MRDGDVENYLMLSGIQHMAFCERQWALIHIEKQWEENTRTFGGQQMHERADDPYFTESRGTLLVCRAVPLCSHRLKLYGIADVVEFIRTDDNKGISISGRDGLWMPVPVEYKYGQPKEHDADHVQLCAQAICIEEMFNTDITLGSMYYGKTRHRADVEFDAGLRERVFELAEKMSEYYNAGFTPLPVRKKSCSNCSLVRLCVPGIGKKSSSVKSYINRMVGNEEK